MRSAQSVSYQSHRSEKTTTNQLRGWCRTSVLSGLTFSVSSHSEEKELPVVTPNKKKRERAQYWVWQVNQFKGAGSGGEIFHHPDLCFYIWQASVSTHGCACIIDFTAGAEFPTRRSALKKQHSADITNTSGSCRAWTHKQQNRGVTP